ncbi:hypothetical protein [Salinisphaera sp.]|uniref:hypothetical protein n=1 Tax=Salinisphaera sp. TaxID=1914330 RepID=UPI002D77A242|nr:hypothetical protein [Salinisphaera sp.]
MSKSNTNKPDPSDQELSRLAAISDDDIDTSDIAEVTDWSHGERGRFYRLLCASQDLTRWFYAARPRWFYCFRAFDQPLYTHKRTRLMSPAPHRGVWIDYALT